MHQQQLEKAQSEHPMTLGIVYYVLVRIFMKDAARILRHIKAGFTNVHLSADYFVMQLLYF